ncbi:MAG: hypothetical protein QOD66_1391 [Solirubrobacteraceae bacterium]|nr:hypothetical protein [Solirubrobacteraceae bacterium]
MKEKNVVSSSRSWQSSVRTLGSLVDQMPFAVVVADAATGEIAHFNARAEELAQREVGRGALPSGVKGWEIHHLDGRPYELKEWPLVRAIAFGEEVIDEEYFYFLRNGRRATVRCSSGPIYDAGRIVAGVLTMREIAHEQRLAEERIYHAMLLENIQDGVLATDRAFVLTAWNRGAEELFGWTEEEALGRPVYELLPQGYSASEQRDEMRHLIDTGRWRGEHVWYTKDGSPVRAEGITVALKDGRGDTTGYLCIMRDTRERDRAREDARQGTQTVLERITDGFFALDLDWRFTYSNGRAVEIASRLTGGSFTREKLLGQTLWEILPAVAGTRLEERLRSAVRDQVSAAFEYMYPDDGQQFEVRAYPSADGLSVYLLDVTEQRDAEQERLELTRRNSSVAELGLRALASDDLQTLLDEAVTLTARALGVGVVTLVEIVAGGQELLLRAAVGCGDGAVGQVSTNVGPASLIGYTVMAGEPVISQDLTRDGRFSTRATLAEHGLSSAVSVLIAGRDEPFGALAAFSKVRHAFAEEDLSFVQAVANAVATAAERGEVQQRLIEVREAERRRIARDLHDEALQGLTYAISRAQAPAGSDEAVDRLTDLVPALERVSAQVRGAIFDLRMAGEHNQPLPDLLRSLVALHAAMADGCEITLEVGEGVPADPVSTVGTQLLRILGEALNNARRHAGANEVKVRVWASSRRVCAEVSDDGRGTETKLSAGTSATGLTGMRERAELMGGHLDIFSELGVGTTVRVELPLGPRDDDPGTVRVLLVEDHVAVREALASAFKSAPGLDVVAQATSLAQARTMLEDVDVVILDLGLPDGFGGDLIAELHAVNRRAHALVLSASLDPSELARAIDSGAAGALNKGAPLETVVDSVRRLGRGENLFSMEEISELLRFARIGDRRERADRAAIEELTPREREVLQGLADGLASQALADRLHISIRTERNHVSNIAAKLGVHSQLQALVFALRYGVVEVKPPHARA